jgi:hypothetical protein
MRETLLLLTTLAASSPLAPVAEAPNQYQDASPDGAIPGAGES